MAIAATNVGLRGYRDGTSLHTDWNTQSTYYLGYNPNASSNYVVVIRFTLSKPAKSVSIPIQCDGRNLTTSVKTLSYELGPDPLVDASKINILASPNALGTFYFRGNTSNNNSQVTLVLGQLSAGTHYLYIYSTDPKWYTTETTMDKNVTLNGVTYEEMDCVVYIDNGSSWDAYQIYIDNGSSWDLYQAYIDNGSGWDVCG